MSEHYNTAPMSPEQIPEQSPDNSTHVDLGTLYIFFPHDPRGTAALPENVEYDVRGVSPLE